MNVSKLILKPRKIIHLMEFVGFYKGIENNSYVRTYRRASFLANNKVFNRAFGEVITDFESTIKEVAILKSTHRSDMSQGT